MIPAIDVSMPYNNHTFPSETCEAQPGYTAEQVCEIKQRHFLDWYTADYVYARSTVYIVCILLASVAAARLYWRWVTKKGRASQTVARWKRTVALFRWMAVRGVSIPGWSNIVIGNCIVLSIFGLFFLLMTLAPGMYYWPGLEWADSPPLATRTGWLAVAMLPFQILLASKRNPIALLLDCSHEQLQVFHRWAAFFMLLLGLIHGLVFIRRDVAAGMLSMDWSTNFFYWTGIATIVPMIWLTLMSLAPIRNMFYEFFKLTHRLAAAIFVVFFFLHCGWTLTAWDYFYALAAFYVPSVAARIVLIAKNRRTLLRSPSSGYAHLRVIAENLLEIRVPQSQLNWQAGQHFFIRFTGLDWITGAQSHPLTAITASSQGSRDMVALAKVGGGELGRLALLASVQEKETLTVNVWLDGPYGRTMPSLAQYDRVLFLGAGSGLTYVASVLQEVILRDHDLSQLHLVGTCSYEHQLDTYLEGVLAAIAEKSEMDKERSRTQSMLIERHVTAGEPAAAEVQRRRPDVRRIIRREAQELCHSRLAIVACGPQQFMSDVAAEVCALQWEIMTDKSSLTEVYYRSEAYHW